MALLPPNVVALPHLGHLPQLLHISRANPPAVPLPIPVAILTECAQLVDAVTGDPHVPAQVRDQVLQFQQRITLVSAGFNPDAQPAELVAALQGLLLHMNNEFAQVRNSLNEIIGRLDDGDKRSTNGIRLALGLNLVPSRRYGRQLPVGVRQPATLDELHAMTLEQMRALLAYHLEVEAADLEGRTKAQLLPALRQAVGLETVTHSF